MEDIRDTLKNTKAITQSDTMQEHLMNFERVLDHLNLYVFSNWIDGELVAGPEVKKYWVVCGFMWPKSKMPDPAGGAKLLNYGCKVLYKKAKLKTPVEVESPDDFEPGTKYPKMVKKGVWLVEIMMPQKLIKDIARGSVELEDETVDVSNLDDAIDQDVDDEMYQDPSQSMMGDIEQQQQGQGMAPPAGQPL